MLISTASFLTSATIDPSDYTISQQLHSKLILHAKIDGVSRGNAYVMDKA